MDSVHHSALVFTIYLALSALQRTSSLLSSPSKIQAAYRSFQSEMLHRDVDMYHFPVEQSSNAQEILLEPFSDGDRRLVPTGRFYWSRLSADASRLARHLE